MGIPGCGGSTGWPGTLGKLRSMTPAPPCRKIHCYTVFITPKWSLSQHISKGGERLCSDLHQVVTKTVPSPITTSILQLLQSCSLKVKLTDCSSLIKHPIKLCGEKGNTCTHDLDEVTVPPGTPEWTLVSPAHNCVCCGRWAATDWAD